MSAFNPDEALDGVAIVGMSGRFPGAANIDELWHNLCNGLESITFFRESELDSSISPALIKNPDYVRARGTFNDIDKFDAAFFGISPREAELMDPQQRIFLEVAWEALENAGYNTASYDGLTGVFAGCGFNSYYVNNVLANEKSVGSLGEHQTQLGNAPDSLATRISFKMNLRGPSISLYTGCSTSLVAVCFAFDSLMSFQCDMALAGGIFITCPPNSGYLFQEGEILSKDGHVRPFDAKASGTVFSSGAGAVVLKRFEDAIRDNDMIYAVIRGAAVNNDGAEKISFTAPSINGQADVIAMAHASAGVDASEISFVETHGTGTSLGDPIEIEALTQAFHSEIPKNGYCALGSIKANLGHMDAAAGIAGLIKTALCLHYKKIPPLINFEKSNPQIDFSKTPFYVNTELKEWNAGNVPRRAGISSFGVGGTNSHVILEEGPVALKNNASRQWYLLNLSAKSENALSQATYNLTRFLKNNDKVNLGCVAHTLQSGRNSFKCRRIGVCRDIADAVTIFEKPDLKRVVTSDRVPVQRDIIFMFSGQGSQYPNMGFDLYREEAVYRQHVDQCCDILKKHLTFDLKALIYSDDFKEVSEKLKQTAVTQPALFTVEYALAKLWMSWGVVPSALVGHSIGEYVAACLAGVFSLDDALFLVAVRGNLIQQTPKGSMLTVFAPEDQIRSFLSNDISLAAINAPSLCVVSGNMEAIRNFEKILEKNKIYCKPLHVSHAFHSNLMSQILNSYGEQVKKVEMKAPEIPIFSNVSGRQITTEDALKPSYWVDHLRKTVRFSDCVGNLLKKRNRIFLEVGPGNTLATLASQHSEIDDSHIVLSSMRHPDETISDSAFILRTLGQLWLAGNDADWHKLYNELPVRIPLPTYPFEKKRFWLGAKQKILRENDETDVSAFYNQKTEKRIENDGLNNVEQNLLKIMKNVLGFKHIGIHDDYFDLGGSSLMAVRVFNQIEKKFGVRLPLATLYEAPTIKQLADIIGLKEYSPLWSALIPIKPEGSNPPFFCVHGAGGNVLLYRGLAKHLDADQPFYGIQCVGMDGKESFLASIEEMAARYINEMKKHQPEGPYYLGGYCMGGQIAFEMARQLEIQGQRVGFLALFDSHCRYIEEKRLHWKVYKLFQNIGFHLKNIIMIDDIKGRYDFIKERALEAKRRLSLRTHVICHKTFKYLRLRDEPPVMIMENINDRACWNYIANPYHGKVTVFKPLSAYAGYEDPELGWGNVCEEVEVQQLPVFPAGMLVEPFNRLLAERFQNCLNAAVQNN